MKILQMIYSLCQGGAERFVVNLSNELSRRGHDVTIMTLRNLDGDEGFNAKFVNPSVQIISLNIKPGFSIGKVRQVEKAVIEIDPDVIHCHLNVIPYLFRFAFFRKYRIVHTLHSLAEYTCGSRSQKYLNKFFYSSGRILPVTISEECRKSYLRLYSVTYVSQIDNGVSVPVKTKYFNEVETEISDLKMSEDTKIFIHVARFSPQKNQQMLIRAFNKLDEEGLNFRLLIIGGKFDTPEAQGLKDEACNKISFLGLKSNVADYLYCSDAFCLTSTYEGLPLSLLEALACGVVPISTPCGGVVDVIKPDIGIISSGFSDVDYVQSIKRFIDGSSLFSKDKLISYFTENYSMETCAEKYEKVYRMH